MFAVWLILWYFVMSVLEYSIHRYTMHNKKRFLPDWIFFDHAILHHKNGRNDINIDLPIYNHLIVGFPLIVGAYMISYSSLSALLCIFAFHSYTWTKVHRGIHGLEKNWLMKTKYYKKAKEHHELHHDRPGKNFGVVFLFTDRLFGTKA